MGFDYFKEELFKTMNKEQTAESLEEELIEIYNTVFNEGYDYYREELNDDVENVNNTLSKLQYTILRREMQQRGFNTEVENV